MQRIELFFRKEKRSNCHTINDQTAADLHLEEVFHILNHTKSAIGEQYFYRMLRSIPEKSEFADFESWIQDYTSNPILQQLLEKELKKLNNNYAYDIYSLIDQKHSPYKKYTVLIFRILQLIPALLLGLFFITNSGMFLVALTLSMVVNLIIHYRSKSISFFYSESIPQLYNLLHIAAALCKKPEIKQINPTIPEALKKTKELKNKLAVFRLDVKMESDLLIFAWAIKEFIRIFFLSEPLSLNIIFKQIKEKRETLKQIFCFIGLTDCLQSIAKARQLIPYYSIPELSETENLEATDMYHPLIPDCVSNSFSSKGKSFLILGSNMSGKTSFTRMIGVNTLIAQTLNICFAKHFSYKKCNVHSLLSVHDDLLQGESYYLSEVLHMKEIISNTEKGNHLILLDELFKGTNTVERIAAAKAVLDYLVQNKGNTIVAATHDTELVPLLAPSFIPLYFTEDISNNRLSFSYKLSTTPNIQRNAVRILSVYNYPDSIVKNALELITNS